MFDILCAIAIFVPSILLAQRIAVLRGRCRLGSTVRSHRVIGFTGLSLLLAVGIFFDGTERGPVSLLGTFVMLWGLAGIYADAHLGKVSRLRVQICFAGFVVGFYVLELLVWLPNTVFWEVDTPSYWDFAMQRTFGYPLILHLFSMMPGDFRTGVVLQFLVAGLSTLFLGQVLRQTFQSTILAAAVIVLLTVKQGMILQHLTLLTDSLFSSCCSAALALLLLLCERQSWGRIMAITAVLAIAACLRPAVLGIILPFALIAAVLLWQGRIKLGLGLAAGLALASAVNSLAHPLVAYALGKPDAVIGNIAPYSLISTAGFLLTSETPTTNAALRDRLVSEFAPFRNAWLKANGPIAQFEVLLPQSDRLLYGHAIPATCEVIMAPCINPYSPPVAAAMEEIAWESIIHDPIGMAHIIYVRLWNDVFGTNGPFSGAWVAHQAPAFATLKKLEMKHNDGVKVFNQKNYRTAATADLVALPTLGIPIWLDQNSRYINLYLFGCCVTSFAWFALSYRAGRNRLESRALLLSVIGLLWYHLTVSVAQSPIPRYTDPMTGWCALIMAENLLLTAHMVILVRHKILEYRSIATGSARRG